MRVLLTKHIDQTGIDMIRAHGHEVRMCSQQSEVTRESLIAELGQYQPHALITLLTDAVDEVVLSASPSLAIISNYAVGYNNIDIEAATKRKVFVTNTPDVLTESVAEFTIALMLSVARHVVHGDAIVRSKQFHGWEPLGYLGIELHGATLGLIGVGRIGSRVAEIARNGFGMNICYYDINRSELFEKATGARFCAQVESIMQNADIVSIHTPLTESTRGMINARALQCMKRTAILINTARGQIVNESDLADVLQNERIAGAGLDVFENEPDVHPRLLGCKNVILTPHIASATERARSEMSRIVGENILAVFRGIVPPHAINAKKTTYT